MHHRRVGPAITGSVAVDVFFTMIQELMVEDEQGVSQTFLFKVLSLWPRLLCAWDHSALLSLTRAHPLL